MVGNSLTYSNDLPKLIEMEASEYGISLDVDILAYANYAIVDHLEDGELQRLVVKEKYDYVIVQQGPSSQMPGRQMLIADGRKLQVICDSVGSQLVYFMVWPSLKYLHTFDDVIQNHKDASRLNKALLCPVGVEWKKYTDRGDYSLYSADGFHPSRKGSLLAAKIIVETLFVENPDD